MEHTHFLAVTDRGFGKRIEISDFQMKRRKGAGVIAIKFKDKAGGSRRKQDGDGGEGNDALRCKHIINNIVVVVVRTVSDVLQS